MEQSITIVCSKKFKTYFWFRFFAAPFGLVIEALNLLRINIISIDELALAWISMHYSDTYYNWFKWYCNYWMKFKVKVWSIVLDNVTIAMLSLICKQGI